MNQSDLSPAMACDSVPPSMYSSSPPRGTPWAMRLAKRTRERAGELARALAVALEQMIGHALRRLRPDAGQTAQRLHQLGDQRGVAGEIHQNGIFMPAGRPMPAVTLAIFSWVRLSIWRTASLTAAASKSSSISLSSFIS